MRIFLDTEFIEDGQTIDLVSIGMVSDDNREYYAISTEFDESKASDWVKKNVIAQLEPRNQRGATFWKPRSQIREDVTRFVSVSDVEREKLEFWGYYADYDWVVLCQLFGLRIDLPEAFPTYCHDIKQLCDEIGNPRLPRQLEGEHNALADARWNKQAWEFLRDHK